MAEKKGGPAIPSPDAHVRPVRGRWAVFQPAEDCKGEEDDPENEDEDADRPGDQGRGKARAEDEQETGCEKDAPSGDLRQFPCERLEGECPGYGDGKAPDDENGPGKGGQDAAEETGIGKRDEGDAEHQETENERDPKRPPASPGEEDGSGKKDDPDDHREGPEGIEHQAEGEGGLEEEQEPEEHGEDAARKEGWPRPGRRGEGTDHHDRSWGAGGQKSR